MSIMRELFSAPQSVRLGFTLLHFLWQGLLVAAVVAITLRLLRYRQANLRYIIATCALCALAVAPVATFIMIDVPPAEVLVEESPSGPVDKQPLVIETNPTAVNEHPASARDAAKIENHNPIIPAIAAAGPGSLAAGHGEAQAEVAAEDSAGQTASLPPSISKRVDNFIHPTLPYIVGGWIVGIFLLGLWRLVGYSQVRKLTRNGALPVPSKLQEKLEALQTQLRISRPVRLMVSAIAAVPSVIGWLRPVILLPASVISGLSPEQIEAILAHELAHIRRYDYLINTVQIIIETLGFYHPAVWWISKRIRSQREHCCDDLAIATCGSRLTYARALATLEELRAAPALGVPTRATCVFPFQR